MRRNAVLVLMLLSAPAVWAAVLPFDLATSTGGGRGLAQGKPVGITSSGGADGWKASVPSAALAEQSSQPAAYRGEWTADTRNTWRGDDGEPRVQFNLRTDAGDHRWGFGVRLRELAGLPAAALSGVATDVQFSWTREAGTFRFTGSFDDGRGRGSYTFTPDQAFVTNMANTGYRNLSSDDIVRMAMLDVTVAHVRGLAQAGYGNLPLDDLVRTRIHRVTPEFIRDLAALGHKGLPIADLVRFSIHKVTADFVRALEARGYKDVPADDLVKMRIHRVTPDEIDQLKTLGFGNISVDQLVKFRIHKVTPEYIRSMREVGFTAISEDQLVRMRIHKVDALFVRHAREDGFAVQTPGEAIDLAIHGPRWRRRK